MRRKFAFIGSSLVMSFLLAASAIGNALALHTKGANNVSFTIGEPPLERVGYYLVGTGSFVTGDEWSADGGIQLYADPDNRGALYTQYLTAGDVFKITDGGDEWYGWGEKSSTSDTTNFRTAYFDYYDNGTWKNYNNGLGDTTANGKHTYYVNHSSYYLWKMYLWNSSGNNGWDHDDEHGGVTHTSHPGGEGSHIYGYDNGRWVNDTYGTATNVIFSDNGSNTNRVETTFASNGNIVVATTGYYDIYLNNDTNGKIHIIKVA